MKVKPFYIRTAGLTEKQVGEAMDKCISAGAKAYEGVSAYHADSDFNGGLMTFDIWDFFGVDASNSTCFEDDGDLFDGEEIKLDQLDEWLGLDKTETPEEKEAFDSMANNSELPNSSGWKCGDECVINRKSTNGELLIDVGTYYGETDSHYWLHGIGGLDSSDKSGNIYCKSKYWLSKPETQQQREERERLEHGEEMYIQHCKNMGADKFYWDEKNSASKEAWCKLAEQYRKAK